MHRSYDNTNRREFLLGGLGLWPFAPRGSIALAGARFRIARNGRSARRYLHIHGNESTAREVLTGHLRKFRGTAFFIQGDLRNVAIQGGWLDPNRMFSRDGADRNLRRLNPDWTDSQVAKALAELDRGRARLIRTLLPPAGGLLLAVHNNAQGYSVQEETPISDEVSLRQPERPHEFFLCTQPVDFRILADSAYNTVLQQRPKGEEDGSLSRLAARRGVRYVNLECGLGRNHDQIEMLEWAETHLS